MTNASGKWRFFIDRGGTFTDVVAEAPDGAVRTVKLLSEDPAYPDAAMEAVRRLTESGSPDDIAAAPIAEIRMGTTVATNALLEYKGAKTALLITKGFRDALLIGDQRRAHLFRLHIERAAPLYERVVEIDERVNDAGEKLIPLNEDQVREALGAFSAAGIRSVAICFMHGYRFPAHEETAAKIAADMGFAHVSTSHGTARLCKFVPRSASAVADAYLTPILRDYVDRVARRTGDIPLYFMQSSGGLARSDAFSGKDAVLSGPAGGIVGAAAIARQAGLSRIIAFDMGGTSTDVAHYDGGFDRQSVNQVAGHPLMVPMIDIHTVAAGGGSICFFDGSRARVGPESAGADPGPAAYGRGGPLTVTDCNLLTGRLVPELFPKVFGPGGDAPLDKAAAQAALAPIAEKMRKAGLEKSDAEIADGFLEVATETMARAVRKITIERGIDIRRYALVAYGGAGGQHAARLAEALGISRILIHDKAGVLSALGIATAPLTVIERATLAAPLTDDEFHKAENLRRELVKTCRERLLAQGAKEQAVRHQVSAHVRYEGSDAALAVPYGTAKDMQRAFDAAHEQAFGFRDTGKQRILQDLSVETEAESPGLALAEQPSSSPATPAKAGRMFRSGKWVNAPIYRRDELAAGQTVSGPAIIIEDHGTNVIEAGWRAEMSRDGLLVLTRQAAEREAEAATRRDPILLEIFNNRFMSVAEEMGGVLESTAHSVNIKERLDFSCAVFDREGGLVANAPHMPVHLGSMGESVRHLLALRELRFGPGDVIALNDPYHGGTHLPDVTVVMPVYLEGSDRADFYVASRGHHADIGGLTPGSMPANSKTLAEEGVVLDAVPVVREGKFLEDDFHKLLTSADYPARNPQQNIADLKAQIAALKRGEQQLHTMVDEFGRASVEAYMGHIQDNAEEAVKRAIGVLEDGSVTYPLDIGAEIRLKITVDRDAQTARLDFTGTSRAGDHNYNAPLAVTKAAVLFAFRALVDDEIPLNAGCLKPLEIVVPEGSLLNPPPGRAVAAGNVETSQAVTNAILLAMGKLAASQGTMNNLTFGNADAQYYETLAGGAGAGDGFTGADAIHTHMTNSKLTDPEVIEARFPVLVDRYEVRQGSGGPGRWRGGHGLIRRIRFLEDVTLSILSNHRETGPPGLAGGQPGKAGINRVIRKDGTEETLQAADTADLAAGDAIEIETPGGGGYGPSKD